jgi:hypothetical protein
MKIQESTFAHPVRADQVRVTVYRDGAGFLVTEARNGTSIVFATLGAYDSQDAAIERAQKRINELLRQRYTKVDAAP